MIVLKEIALGGQNFLYQKEELAKISAKIPALELINGRTYPYSYSTLGRLEKFLDEMETNRIE